MLLLPNFQRTSTALIKPDSCKERWLDFEPLGLTPHLFTHFFQERYLRSKPIISSLFFDWECKCTPFFHSNKYFFTFLQPFNKAFKNHFNLPYSLSFWRTFPLFSIAGSKDSNLLVTGKAFLFLLPPLTTPLKNYSLFQKGEQNYKLNSC